MKMRSKWSNVSKTCVRENSDQLRYTITVTTVTDVTQLVIMLVGLLRSCKGNQHGLLSYLYIQVGGVVFRVSPLTMATGLGLGMARHRDDRGDSICGGFDSRLRFLRWIISDNFYYSNPLYQVFVYLNLNGENGYISDLNLLIQS